MKATSAIHSKTVTTTNKEMDEHCVPDLMGSSSSLSYSDTGSVLFNKSANGSFSGNTSFNSTSVVTGSSFTTAGFGAAHHAFQNSGFFKKKQARAAKKIQALARGFIVRVGIHKGPLLAELKDIQRRQEEELERIECQKKAEMESFRREMEQEFDQLKEALAEAKILITHLKEEKIKYENENAILKQECKELKKANKLLKKEVKNDDLAVDLTVAEQRVTILEHQTATREEIAEKYLQNISTYQKQIKEAEEQTVLEKVHTQRLKVCISSIFDTIEPRGEYIMKKLLKIAAKNKVFLKGLPELCPSVYYIDESLKDFLNLLSFLVCY